MAPTSGAEGVFALIDLHGVRAGRPRRRWCWSAAAASASPTSIFRTDAAWPPSCTSSPSRSVSTFDLAAPSAALPPRLTLPASMSADVTSRALVANDDGHLVMLRSMIAPELASFDGATLTTVPLPEVATDLAAAARRLRGGGGAAHRLDVAYIRIPEDLPERPPACRCSRWRAARWGGWRCRPTMPASGHVRLRLLQRLRRRVLRAGRPALGRRGHPLPAGEAGGRDRHLAGLRARRSSSTRPTPTPPPPTRTRPRWTRTRASASSTSPPASGSCSAPAPSAHALRLLAARRLRGRGAARRRGTALLAPGGEPRHAGVHHACRWPRRRSSWAPCREAPGITPHRVFVSQDHPAGRISVIQLDTGQVRTATGFTLNGRSSDDPTPRCSAAAGARPWRPAAPAARCTLRRSSRCRWWPPPARWCRWCRRRAARW